jgi:hypothetical protein
MADICPRKWHQQKEKFMEFIPKISGSEGKADLNL